jgi:diguanylate cyclase (GGDEF)-like protein
MIIIACILYVILLYETVNMSTKYQSLLDTTQDYISSEKDAAMLSEASDYLTEQARLYAINMDISYMEAYFDETNVNKRRDQAFEDLKKYHSDDTIYAAMQNALECSNALMETEKYSMKLISVANKYDTSTLPKEIQKIELSNEDTNLSKEEMIKKARQLVFDSDYQQAKSEIQNYVDMVIDPILVQTQKKRMSSAEELKAVIMHDRFVLSILLITNIISFASIAILVIRPLHNYSKNIDDEKPLDVSGAYEFQYLAQTYNNVYSRNAANEAILRQKAECDALTGILNRHAFDEITKLLENTNDNIALLLIDVDNFKSINDGYGHDVGDQVLKKVALMLRDSFRPSDHIARIGGDEFAVIMSNTTRQLQPVIRGKADEMNILLTNPYDGLPKISLSIGVAFSGTGYSKELFNQSDHALYEVKEGGRCGCKFYN